MNETLPMQNPPEHTRLRRFLGNMFNGGVLDSLRPVIQRAVQRQLDHYMNRLREGPADFVTHVSEEIPVVTIGEWMEIPRADYGLLRALTHDQVYTQELFPTASEIEVSDAATARLRFYFADLVQERRRKPGTDPVSLWIQRWDAIEPERDTADSTIHSIAIFMILAALETTSHLLANVVRLLLEHPDQLAQLQENDELIPDAIEEVLRYDAPIHMISRVAAEPTELAGAAINAGEIVHLMVGSAHHDPTHYREPHLFDVRRRLGGPAGHLSFGAGIHYCLGSTLARLEAEVLLKALLPLPLSRLQIAAPPQWAPRVAFRRMTTLPLALN
ncbi:MULTISPECIES: cytochrome P450 [unclassified Streptomyces]|uniref:cytochrome P450 n=1 Tax=unclassified Streptomyces TaxID=2593676 RepID=UPI002D21BBAB|nr:MULTISPECIES: cytochrome P450 [unclassified Streptomyces]